MLTNWLFLLLPMVGFVLLVMWMRQRSRDRLHRWATAQGYIVIRITNPPFMRPGPFFLQHPRGRVIACLFVRNGDTGERMGWVRYPAGLALLGPGDFTDVELIWDDERDRQQPPIGRRDNRKP